MDKIDLKKEIDNASILLTNSIKKLDILLEKEDKKENKIKYIKLLKEGIFYSSIILEISEKYEELNKDYLSYELESIKNYYSKIKSLNEDDLPF